MKKYTFLLLLLIYTMISCSSMKSKKNIAIDYYNLGNNYFQLKEYDKAATSFEKALEYDPNSEETILNLLLSYQYDKKYVKVENQILKYFKKVNNDFTKKLLLMLGNNYYLQEKYDKAIKAYTEYKEIYPEDIDCYFNLGLTYTKIANEKKALESFIEAYKINSKHLPVIYNLADYYYNHDDLQNSLYYFLLLNELDNKNPEVSYRLADIEYKIEEYEEAKKHLLQAIEIDSTNNTYYLLLAKIYSKGYKDKKKTLEALENTLKNGFKDFDKIQKMDEFLILKEYDEYKKLFKKYEIK